jgi:hypothetical protein
VQPPAGDIGDEIGGVFEVVGNMRAEEHAARLVLDVLSISPSHPSTSKPLVGSSRMSDFASR